jgi:DedD protein
VGAFSSQASASAAVDKVRETGVKVYTETVKTERGERIRVRVGPFASREAAEDAREKLKAAGLNAALIAPQ